MKNFTEVLVQEINSAFKQITKKEEVDISRVIVDILIREGFTQHKMVDLYKRCNVEQDVMVMRLNKQINSIYENNLDRLNELKLKEEEEGIPDNPMNIWLSEVIEEDLFNGRAPFKNTKKNIKILHDIAISYDPLFNAIEFELGELYNHVAREKLIEPISFVDSMIEQDRPSKEDSTPVEKPEQLIDTRFEDSVEVEEVEEYIDSPFGGIIDG